MLAYFRSTPKRLFLIDSIGALVTAILLGLVMPRFESMFGMPANVLLLLSVVACIFCMYSFLCYLFLKARWRVYLRIIAFANLLYCCTTLALVVYFQKVLTLFGVVYFGLEIIVISCLAVLETKTDR